jgi:hypothetical protein
VKGTTTQEKKKKEISLQIKKEGMKQINQR